MFILFLENFSRVPFLPARAIILQIDGSRFPFDKCLNLLYILYQHFNTFITCYFLVLIFIARCLSICLSEALDLASGWTDNVVLIWENRHWSCIGFKLFSGGLGHPKPPKKRISNHIFFC